MRYGIFERTIIKFFDWYYRMPTYAYVTIAALAIILIASIPAKEYVFTVFSALFIFSESVRLHRFRKAQKITLLANLNPLFPNESEDFYNSNLSKKA